MVLDGIDSTTALTGLVHNDPRLRVAVYAQNDNRRRRRCGGDSRAAVLKGLAAWAVPDSPRRPGLGRPDLLFSLSGRRDLKRRDALPAQQLASAQRAVPPFADTPALLRPLRSRHFRVDVGAEVPGGRSRR